MSEASWIVGGLQARGSSPPRVDSNPGRGSAVQQGAVPCRGGAMGGNRMKRRSLVLLVALAGLAGTARPAAAAITAFTNVRLVPMTAERVIPGQSVIVVDGKIARVGPMREVRVPPGAVVIDGGGRYLMPGLADMHTHFNDAMFEHPFCNLFLANGVTTVRDLAQGSPPTILRLRRDIEASRRLGPNILVAYTIWGNEPDIAGLVASQRPLGYDCLKVNSWFTPAGFDTVMRAAQALRWYVLGHIPTLVRLDGVLAAGVPELSHIEELIIFELLDIDWSAVTDNDSFESQLLASLREATRPFVNASAAEIRAAYRDRVARVARKLRGRDITLTTTLIIHEDILNKLVDPDRIRAAPHAAYVAPTFWRDLAAGTDKHQQMVVKGEERAWFTVYELQRMLCEELRKNNVRLVLGTDTGPTYLSLAPGFAVHDELRTLVDCGFSPYAALVSATRTAAEVAARMTGRNDFGTIETGKRADLILLDRNPLESVANLRSPVGVMVRGRWLPADTLAALLAVRTRKIGAVLDAAYAEGGCDGLLARYREITDGNLRNAYYYSAGTLIQAGYKLLANDRVDDALRVFHLETEEYPEDWNAFDSYGEALLKVGLKGPAIENYERARALDPGQESPRKALLQLRQE